MRNLSSCKWLLLNAEQAQETAPRTFKIPSEKERMALKTEKVVKLYFVPEDAGTCRAERMWVKVNRVSGEDFYGELLNEPLIVKVLPKGSEIAFQKIHVATILIGTNDPRWIDETKYALVSNHILEGKTPVRFLYRETPDKEEDSGWRLFSGEEDDDYVADPNNIRLRTIEAVLSLDESLEAILNKPVFTAFERRTQDEPFLEVKDFQFSR